MSVSGWLNGDTNVPGIEISILFSPCRYLEKLNAQGKENHDRHINRFSQLRSTSVGYIGTCIHTCTTSSKLPLELL
jgi:hypothetical protein